jgi:ribonuclease P protein component
LIDTKATYSFSRARRLDGPHAYAAVFAYKCWVNGRWFQVYAKPNGAEIARLGVVVSKRIMKKAVARNYYKRLARDVFRHECADVAGADFVVRPRERIESDAAVPARVEMANLLRRAHSQCRNRQSATMAG